MHRRVRLSGIQNGRFDFFRESSGGRREAQAGRVEEETLWGFGIFWSFIQAGLLPPT